MSLTSIAYLLVFELVLWVAFFFRRVCGTKGIRLKRTDDVMMMIDLRACQQKARQEKGPVSRERTVLAIKSTTLMVGACYTQDIQDTIPSSPVMPSASSQVSSSAFTRVRRLWHVTGLSFRICHDAVEVSVWTAYKCTALSTLSIQLRQHKTETQTTELYRCLRERGAMPTPVSFPLECVSKVAKGAMCYQPVADDDGHFGGVHSGPVDAVYDRTSAWSNAKSINIEQASESDEKGCNRPQSRP